MSGIALVRRSLGPFGVVITMICLLFPVYWLIQSSLSTQNELFHTPSYLFPPHPTLDAYRRAIPLIAPALGNSLIIASGAVALTLFVAVTTAYGLILAQAGPSGRLLRGLVLLGLVFPVIMFVIPLYEVFYRFHLLNSYVGLILADSLYSVPLGVVIMYTYMVTLPEAFTEAARVDGASRGLILRRIILPLSRPAAATVAIFAFLAAWGDYLFASALTSGGTAAPGSTAVFTLISSSTGGVTNWPEVMAASVVLGLPTLLAVVLAQGYIRAGLSQGGVVG
jgi:multiple sugar transport system permease protein